VALGIAHTQGEYRGDECDLDGYSPAAPSPQRQRWRQPVDERRPHELERVGRANQGEGSDRSTSHAGGGEPSGKGRKREQQRQTAGETEREDQQHAPVGIDGE
jgi:hypothetical protein